MLDVRWKLCVCQWRDRDFRILLVTSASVICGTRPRTWRQHHRNKKHCTEVRTDNAPLVITSACVCVLSVLAQSTNTISTHVSFIKRRTKNNEKKIRNERDNDNDTLIVDGSDMYWASGQVGTSDGVVPEQSQEDSLQNTGHGWLMSFQRQSVLLSGHWDRSVSSTFGHDENTLPSQNLRPRPTGKQRHSASHDIRGQWPPLSSNKQQAQTAHVGRSPGLPPSKVETESSPYPRIVCEPVLGVAANTMYAHMCGVVKPSKKHQNPGTPRTRSFLCFTRDPGGLVQQHQAPVACFDESVTFPASRLFLPRLQTTWKESCRPALECSSPSPTQWCSCCGVHSGRVDHKQLSITESKRPQTASAASLVCQ